MPFEALGRAASRVASTAKATRGKSRVATPKPAAPKYENSTHFSRCPVMAALARHAGRNKRGQIRYLLSAAELRYLVAVGAYANQEGFCKASQGKLADDLGIGRRLASRLEAGIIAKGFAQAIPISRQRGRWGFRILRLIYPPKPQRESLGAENKGSGYLPSQKAPDASDTPPNANKNEEPLMGAR